jgi:hypothetical protein
MDEETEEINHEELETVIKKKQREERVQAWTIYQWNYLNMGKYIKRQTSIII